VCSGNSYLCVVGTVQVRVDMYTYIYIYICICIYVYVYTGIWSERFMTGVARNVKRFMHHDGSIIIDVVLQ
jgi:hypothetical protein